jgi:uncharacterized membrane protein YdjX (TVP38/TMEM64 family)
MKKNKFINLVKFSIFIVIILISICILSKNRGLLISFNIKDISQFIKARGTFSEIIYLLLFFIKPLFIMIPANVMAVIAALAFGSSRGFILTMVGFFISGTVAFYLARFLGKDFVESILGDKLIKLDDKIEKNGFKILLILRLPPIIPFDPLSYACGFTKMRYRDFIFASLLGVIPETVCYSILGTSYKNPFSIKFLLPILLLVISVVLSKKILNRNKERKC